jgi:hypothetical protein
MSLDSRTARFRSGCTMGALSARRSTGQRARRRNPAPAEPKVSCAGLEWLRLESNRRLSAVRVASSTRLLRVIRQEREIALVALVPNSDRFAGRRVARRRAHPTASDPHPWGFACVRKRVGGRSRCKGTAMRRTQPRRRRTGVLLVCGRGRLRPSGLRGCRTARRGRGRAR